MSQTVKVTLATGGGWTLVSAYTDNILTVGVPSGYEIFVGTSAPSSSDEGMPVTALDGGWGTSSLSASDSVYGRPFGAYSAVAIELSVIKS